MFTGVAVMRIIQLRVLHLELWEILRDGEVITTFRCGGGLTFNNVHSQVYKIFKSKKATKTLTVNIWMCLLYLLWLVCLSFDQFFVMCISVGQPMS